MDALFLMASPASADRVVLPDDYVYDRVGKRDPFRSPVTPPPRSSRKLFDRFELEQLRLRAVLTAPDTSWAVVEGPAGFHVLVRDGSRFGSAFLRVQKVTSAALVLEDLRFQTAAGTPVTLLHTMDESPAGP